MRRITMLAAILTMMLTVHAQTYRAANPRLVAAIHAWFDAQVSDHGADATEGHRHAMPH